LESEVLIVGGGLAGLACARQLHARGKSFILLEASDAVGGRVRTDLVDGFRLDRGFQVFLSSYPEPQRWLDPKQLDLRPFLSGARVRYGDRFYDLADPWRRPLTALRSAFNPIGSFSDKLRIAKLRSRSLAGSYEERLGDPELTTADYLQQLGFRDRMIDRFMRPFLGGVFLDRRLQTSSRMLLFVFRMFARGDACLPAAGMQALPEQIAAPLPADSVRLNAAVAQVEPGRVTLRDGRVLQARHIVMATDAPSANQLLPGAVPDSGCSVRCIYFAAPAPPFPDRLLVLNGDGTGPINNLCVPTNVAPSYGPTDESLISVTVLDWSGNDSDLEVQVRAQLQAWYGSQVNQWRHLRSYHIRYALPNQAPPALSQPQRPVQLDNGILICGDHRDQGSIEGALVSGRRAADAVLEASV
jgi:phytoene dehydrogenase-like protein